MARWGGFRPPGRVGPAAPPLRVRGGLQDYAPVTEHPAMARHPPSPHTLKLLVAPVLLLVISSHLPHVIWPPLPPDHPPPPPPAAPRFANTCVRPSTPPRPPPP